MDIADFLKKYNRVSDPIILDEMYTSGKIAAEEYEYCKKWIQQMQDAQKRILEHVKKEGSFFVPEWKGGYDNIPFTHEEYRDWSNDLSRRMDDEAIDVSDIFATYLMPFQYEGTNFVLRLMFGQGSCLDLYTEDCYRSCAEDLPEDALFKEIANESNSDSTRDS